MDFDLSDEQQLLYDSALAYFRAELGPLVERMDREDVWPDEIWSICARQGYLGAAIPEAYGGSGGDYMTAALICQAMTRVSPAAALSVGAHLNLCAHNLMRNGTEEQRQRYLPKLASGEWVGALALTEPDAGSDAMGIRTTARREGDHYVLNGSKMWITNGPNADVLVVYAKTDPDAGSRGITAFILESGMPGFGVARKLDKVGMRGSPTGELFFQDVRVPSSHVLGVENQGVKVVMSGLDLERAFFACSGLGVMEESLEIALRYAQERSQFGQPIANFQLIQAKLADIYANLQAARLGAYHALLRIQGGHRASLEAAAALLFTAENAMDAADQALQIHGGYGYIKEFPIERIWRDTKLFEIGAGTNEIRRLLIARELLGQRGHQDASAGAAARAR
ncbi:MAG: acyl-CoA dehydrogenase family protein [Candidatus Sericytochromatia bacterium]